MYTRLDKHEDILLYYLNTPTHGTNIIHGK